MSYILYYKNSLSSCSVQLMSHREILLAHDGFIVVYLLFIFISVFVSYPRLRESPLCRVHSDGDGQRSHTRDYPPLGQGHTTLSPSFLAPVVWGSRVTASSWWGGMCCIISGCKHFIASMVHFYPIFACPPRDHGFLMVKSRVMGVLSAWVWEGGWSRLLWPIAGFAWVQVELWELRVSLFRLF